MPTAVELSLAAFLCACFFLSLSVRISDLHQSPIGIKGLLSDLMSYDPQNRQFHAVSNVCLSTCGYKPTLM